MIIIVLIFFLFGIGCQEDLIGTRNVHFISYGNEKFKESRERIEKEAKDTGWFSNVKIYTPENIGNSFVKEHAEFLNNNARGGGYWIWKPYIIREQLKIMNQGDFLVYLDSGSTINNQGKTRLNYYLNVLNDSKSGVLGFQMNYIEKCWTKMDLAKYLGIMNNSSIMDSGQVMATAIIFQKNAKSIELVEKWYELTKVQNYHLLDDSPSILANDKCFEEHRHDQSIFSLLIKKLEGSLLTDEVQFFSNSYPFRATRKRI